MTKLKYGGNNLYKVKAVLEIEGVNNDTCMYNVSELVRSLLLREWIAQDWLL